MQCKSTERHDAKQQGLMRFTGGIGFQSFWMEGLCIGHGPLSVELSAVLQACNFRDHLETTLLQFHPTANPFPLCLRASPRAVDF